MSAGPSLPGLRSLGELSSPLIGVTKAAGSLLSGGALVVPWVTAVAHLSHSLHQSPSAAAAPPTQPAPLFLSAAESAPTARMVLQPGAATAAGGQHGVPSTRAQVVAVATAAAPPPAAAAATAAAATNGTPLPPAAPILWARSLLFPSLSSSLTAAASAAVATAAASTLNSTGCAGARRQMASSAFPSSSSSSPSSLSSSLPYSSSYSSIFSAASVASAMPSVTAPSQRPPWGPPGPHRRLSVQPEAAVYAGPAPRGPSRVTLRTIRRKYEAGEPLTMVTAYDYPSAVHVEAAGIDIALVGDSVAMVVHGHDTTLPIRMDEMISHCKAVARGARRAFLVGDLPFGCYETDVRDAVRSAVRMLKEGGMDAVKLEGGSPARVEAARAIVETGVAVMGHVGLTPQSVSVIGGFRPQAQVAEEALRVLQQAQALQKAGCFAVVLECIPGPIAAAITRTLRIPTIGIGAGGECSGQVLVYHDLLGMMTHPHHAKVTPKFCKQYARVGDIIGQALQQYRQEVEDRTFPGPRFSPYSISDQEVELLAEELNKRGLKDAAQAVVDEAHRAAKEKAAVAAAAAAAAAAPASPSTTAGGDAGVTSGGSGGAAS